MMRRPAGAPLRAAAVLASTLAVACASSSPAPPVNASSAPAGEGQGPEAVSLLGLPLEPPQAPPAFEAQQEELLAAARDALATAPEDPTAWIWIGRRLGYLSRYREAIALYGEALARFPDSAELLRHRGHRYLSVRDLSRALADLELAERLMLARADRVEPDGLPNARNQSTGTLRSNVWYHLGLARYLTGDLAGAAGAWERGLAAVDNADNLVAASYWLFLARAEAGDEVGAAALLEPLRQGELDVIENHEYHRLLLVFAGRYDGELLLAQAEVGGAVQLATVGYGVAAWRLLRGDREAGAALLGRLVRETPWPAFGHLAAEARLANDPDLRRMAGL
jgi:tetratricopeptide (TPR) repeat protein